MKLKILIIGIFMGQIIFAQTKKDSILLGQINIENLKAKPFQSWFDKNYNDYKVNETKLLQLKNTNFNDFSFKIFLGTWCGDSRREVPRFFKIMKDLGITAEKIETIALGGSDSLYKQSPTGEEKNIHIFRVPTFIIYKNGIEINRINEFPVNSLEMDLLSIFKNENYTPNYPVFNIIAKWLDNKILLDENMSSNGLAQQINFFVNNENVLNSLAYLLSKKGMEKEALKLFKINYNLYPNSANIISSLGEGFLMNKEYENAILYLELALKENKNENAIDEILQLLYKAKKLNIKK